MSATPQQSLQDTLSGLAGEDPEKFKLFFRRLRKAFPDEVTEACLLYIAAHGLDSAAEQMAVWLTTDSKYIEILFNPESMPLETAAKAFRAVKGADPRFYSKFHQAASGLSAPPIILRALSLIPSLGDYEVLVPLLRACSHHADERVQSKAVKLLCELRPNKTLIERQMQAEDPRVRASAMEALWHAGGLESVSLFEAALSDPHHRVVANALVGLYLQKDPRAFDKMLELARDSQPLCRAAMAWAFGHIKDKRAVAALENLSQDSSLMVRKRALRSLLALQPDETPAAAGSAQ
jgi:HEAT repeats